MIRFPKYALVDGKRFVRKARLIHGEGKFPAVVRCKAEDGSECYFTEEEWLSAAAEFRDHAVEKGVVTSESPAREKLALFRDLFAGRPDVHAHGCRAKDGGIGYAPVCANEWVQEVCPKCLDKRMKCPSCKARAFAPLTDREIIAHFKGKSPAFKDVLGSYVLDESDETSVLVVDFDKKDWKRAVEAFREVARNLGIDVAVERSRSGNGAHAWVFFTEPVSGKTARDLGSALISLTMSRCKEITFESYDRMFPAQDSLPKNGFGNLIALPFQGAAR